MSTTSTDLDPRIEVPIEQLARCESKQAHQHQHTFPARMGGTRPGRYCLRCGRSVEWLMDRKQRGHDEPLLTIDEWRALQ